MFGFSVVPFVPNSERFLFDDCSFFFEEDGSNVTPLFFFAYFGSGCIILIIVFW